MLKAKTMSEIEPDHEDYWVGYIEGLKQAYYGERYKTMQEHDLWRSFINDTDIAQKEKGHGYHDGLIALNRKEDDK